MFFDLLSRVMPLWWFLDRGGRRRRHEPLFRRGQLVRGSIAAVVRHGEGHFYATYKYAYTVGDVQFRGFIHDPDPLIRYFSEGDAVAVLHDGDDPTASCFVYRPPGRGRRSRALTRAR